MWHDVTLHDTTRHAQNTVFLHIKWILTWDLWLGTVQDDEVHMPFCATPTMKFANFGFLEACFPKPTTQHWKSEFASPLETPKMEFTTVTHFGEAASGPKAISWRQLHTFDQVVNTYTLWCVPNRVHFCLILGHTLYILARTCGYTSAWKVNLQRAVCG